MAVLAIGAAGFVAFHGVRRFQNAESITTDAIKRGRVVRGYVTKVADGDTLRIYSTNFFRRKPPANARPLPITETIAVRLASVDAPELPHFGNPGQPLAADARNHLANLVLNKRVVVNPVVSKDRYGRVVGVVWRGPWFWRSDVGLEMVKAGLAAVHHVKSSPTATDRDSALRVAEESAKSAKRGVWMLGDKYIAPSEFRKQHPSSALGALTDDDTSDVTTGKRSFFGWLEGLFSRK
ncbi:SNase-domain-containing protein [Gonapodya prolifera JEL478]|uniref:SNase-domain-containing protein n=1 Tax=Gonapodya prolifera (strain JEL478) TaxID=1344416 RepID=A0A139A846_GONPJ|nr:SNase-domain-containing protein [Gonapodya prolifera JEL478]|eukprot:KXS12976.1 SNase-domain-containing protein [Gonapodya prolifera JEL478]